MNPQLKFTWPITGNTERLQDLESDLLNQHLSHAYLFSGPLEVGKFSAAKFFAKLILCAKRACNQCEVCQKIAANAWSELVVADELWIENLNEDLTEISRKSNFNQMHRTRAPKAKTDTIGLPDLHEILSRIYVKHTSYQIFLVKNIERLTLEAANFFLKTLEEPPPRTIFLLTTSNLAKVLPTLISRCRLLVFDNVAERIITTMLQQDFPELSVTASKQILHLALGKPIRAIRLARNPAALQEFREYFAKLRSLFEQPDLVVKIQLADQLAASVPEIAKFLEALTYFLRSFLLARAREPRPASRYSRKKLLAIIQLLTETHSMIFQKNVNPRLALENLLFAI